MEPRIKKVTVELDNGNKLEFDKEVVIYAQDEMSVTEKKIHGNGTKICAIAGCSPNFLANVAESILGSLREVSGGLDTAVILAHLEKNIDFNEMLKELFEQ